MQLNLYKLHSNPELLDGYHEAHDKVPHLVWEKYKNNPEELWKREAIFAKDAELAYLYAKDVLKGPFPAGEAAIAKDAKWAFRYAEEVLNKKPFRAGEAAIAKDEVYAYLYAKDVLKKKPFPAGEAAIAKNAELAGMYAAHALMQGRQNPFDKASISKNADQA